MTGEQIEDDLRGDLPGSLWHLVQAVATILVSGTSVSEADAIRRAIEPCHEGLDVLLVEATAAGAVPGLGPFDDEVPDWVRR